MRFFQVVLGALSRDSAHHPKVEATKSRRDLFWWAGWTEVRWLMCIFFEHPYLDCKPMDMSGNLSGCLVLGGLTFQYPTYKNKLLCTTEGHRKVTRVDAHHQARTGNDGISASWMWILEGLTLPNPYPQISPMGVSIKLHISYPGSNPPTSWQSWRACMPASALDKGGRRIEGMSNLWIWILEC